MRTITESSKPVNTQVQNEAKPPLHMVLAHDGETALAASRFIISEQDLNRRDETLSTGPVRARSFPRPEGWGINE